MFEPTLATVVAVPRERFGYAAASLESILSNTPAKVPVIYVDGGSPARIARYVRARAAVRPMRIVRRDYILTPNEARNLGWPLVETRYLVFVDNDVVVKPGWLEALVRCAEDTGADIVGPLTCFGTEGESIHLAGGDLHFVNQGRHRRIVERRAFSYERASQVRERLRRERTELAEFHCMLVRTETMRRLGPLDEQLFSMHEELDLCLTVQEAGGTIYFEPESVIGYVPPAPIDPRDMGYYFLRWSEAWTDASTRRFREKWLLEDDDPQFLVDRLFVQEHRRLALRHLALERTFGSRFVEQAGKTLAPVESVLNKVFFRDARRARRLRSRSSRSAFGHTHACTHDERRPTRTSPDVAEHVLQVLRSLDALPHSRGTELEHALVTATRAERAGADLDMIVGALCHDIGKAISGEEGHAGEAAELLRPYVCSEVAWIVGVHREFMKKYYVRPLGAMARWPWRDRVSYPAAVRFADEWDAPVRREGETYLPLAHFEPLVRSVFGRKPKNRNGPDSRPRATWLREVTAPFAWGVVGVASRAKSAAGFVTARSAGAL